MNKLYGKDYDDKGRFASYWHQISETLKLNSKKILEIGIGTSMVSSYLKRQGLSVVTLDLAPSLTPDLVATVTKIPIKNRSFDVVMCYQVLEHMPFEYFLSALSEISRVSKGFILISLPNRARYFHIGIKLYPAFQKTLCFTMPYLFMPEHKFDGHHYWEIGKKNFSLKKIKAIFKKTSLRLVIDYRVPEKPLHHFFILQKI